MHEIIDKNAPEPIYLQLKNWVEDSIRRGKLLPGQRLPSENEFSRRCGIHRNTARNALLRLEEVGVLRSIPGSGWFVSQPEKRLRRAGMLGLRDPDLQKLAFQSDFYIRINQGLNEGAAMYDFEMVRLTTEEISLLLQGKAQNLSLDALVITEFQSKYLEQLRLLKASNLPVAVFNRQIFGEDIPCVCIDQYYGTRDLVTRLIQSGHRRIGCITMALDANWRYALERYRGYADAFAAAGLTPERKWVCQIRDINQRRRKIRDFLKNNLDLTALFIAGENFHKSALELLRKQGKNIPDDISVVAFDRVGSEYGRQIIALDQPLEEMGRRIFQTLDRMLAGQPAIGEVLLPAITHGNSIRNII
jgi:GntR family transcriptional regulator of arabinose operon